MKLSKINLIISREYAIRVKKKSFILTTILTPLLFALLIAVPSVIMVFSGEDSQKISILDGTGLLEPYFENTKKVEYEFLHDAESSLSDYSALFETSGSSALLVVSGLDAQGNVNAEAYSREPLGLDMRTSLQDKINKALRDHRLASYNIDNLDQILKDVESNVRINAMTVTRDGDTKKDSVEVYMILAYLLSFMIYMFVFMFGSMVMRGVIEEKSSRIVEVIVSSVNSFELMIGKIIGIAAVALTQFVIWIVLTFGLVTGVQAIIGPEKIAAAMQATTAAAGNDGNINPGEMAQIADAVSQSGAADEEGEVAGVMADIMQQLSTINYAYIIGCFLIYFLLGYLLYAAMFAAVGSAVDNEADTNQLSLPVTIPLIIGLFIMLHTFQHPSSQLSFWASIIPFTSPMVMLARIPFGVVPGWQLGLSIALLAATFVLMTWVSGKIYKVGILMYGKKATFKDLYKWIKNKD